MVQNTAPAQMPSPAPSNVAPLPTASRSPELNALLKAQQIYVVDDPSRVWYGFGVSPIVSIKKLTGMDSYPDRIPRFQTAQLAK